MYVYIYKCELCGWTTKRYSEIDGHENQIEPGHLVTGQLVENKEKSND